MSSALARLAAHPYLSVSQSRSPSPSPSPSLSTRSLSSSSSYIPTLSSSTRLSSASSASSTISGPAGPARATRSHQLSSTRSERGTRGNGSNAASTVASSMAGRGRLGPIAGNVGGSDKVDDAVKNDETGSDGGVDGENNVDVQTYVVERETRDGSTDQGEAGGEDWEGDSDVADSGDESSDSYGSDEGNDSDHSEGSDEAEGEDSFIAISSSAFTMSSTLASSTPSSSVVSESCPPAHVRPARHWTEDRSTGVGSERSRSGSPVGSQGFREGRMMGRSAAWEAGTASTSRTSGGASAGEGLVVDVEMAGTDGQGQEQIMSNGRSTEVTTDASSGAKEVLGQRLPKSKLSLRFAESHFGADVPPCFHTGDKIPIMLRLFVDELSSIPLRLIPELNVTITGTFGYSTATPLDVVSATFNLTKCLTVWAKDMQSNRRNMAGPWADNPDKEEALPFGEYTLPIRMPIPSNLPPTLDMAHGIFTFKYSVDISLTMIDPVGLDPLNLVKGETSRIKVANHRLPLIMMRTISPTAGVRFDDLSIIHGCLPKPEAAALHRTLMNALSPLASSELDASWTFFPVLPTTTFSTTSVIPLSLAFVPHNAPPTTILIRMTLLQKQVIHIQPGLKADGTLSPPIETRRQMDICTRAGMFHLPGEGTTILGDMILPLQDVLPWDYGTSAKFVPFTTSTGQQMIAVNAFFIQVETFWTEQSWDEVYPMVIPPGLLDRPNELSLFFTDDKRENLRKNFPGHCHVIDVPIEIGSVGENRDAIRQYRWSDPVDRASGRFSMVHGTAFSGEAGWNVPPPSYRDACALPPVDPAKAVPHMRSRRVRVINLPGQDGEAPGARAS